MKKQRKIVFWAASLLLTGALAAGRNTGVSDG